MLKHYPFQQLGKAQHGWLKTHHHFSFAQYYNPKRMGFASLRVINDDWIAPQTGFPEHPHKNMEIISYIRRGAITHEDSKGNQGVTPAGQVQVMSAGRGIWHSEYNRSDAATTLFQIWIEPNKNNVTPRWDSMKFPSKRNNKQLPLLVSGYPEDKNDALFIHQYARLFGGRIGKGAQIKHAITHQVYILASQGTIELVEGQQRITMNKGDGAEVSLSSLVQINALTDSEVIVIDVP